MFIKSTWIIFKHTEAYVLYGHYVLYVILQMNLVTMNSIKHVMKIIVWYLKSEYITEPACPRNWLLFFLGGEIWCDCPERNLQIQGGHYKLTKQLKTGSMLVYVCPEGYYPYPALTRLCQHNGTWRPAPKRFSPQRCRSEWRWCFSLCLRLPALHDNWDPFALQLLNAQTPMC